MPEEGRILIVEDEKKIADTLAMGLAEHGFSVQVAYDGDMGRHFITNHRWDLVTLDVNLPGTNGFDLCKAIHYRYPHLPVIILSSMNSLTDKMEGYDAGADDYIIKPFEFRELLLRIRSLLRRTSDQSVPMGYILRADDLEMNLESLEVNRAGRKIRLTAKEFRLLEYLVRNQNKMVSRADLSINVWNMDFDANTNVIDVYINHIRHKIDKGSDRKLIHTHVGMGYILDSRPLDAA
jgi:DNA-binding response OmpR family regulator